MQKVDDMLPYLCRCFLMAVLLVFIRPGYGQDAEGDFLFGRLFVEQDPVHLSLQFDIKEFQRTRSKGKYHPASLILEEEGNIMGSWQVRVKARGIFRRQHCRVPPLWLNTRDSGLESEGMAGMRKIKVVSRCKDSKQYAPYVLKEYLVYKMYELLTPCSFRTRLVRLRYIDTGREMKVYEDWAYLIEPEEMVTRRLGARHVNNNDLAMRLVQPHAMDRLAMFQFMIGNTDYSVTGRHNVKILQMDVPGREGLVPVPYDFDFTGMVNTVYANPRDGINAESVRERYYDGPCRSEELHWQVVEEFRELEDQWVELIMSFEYMEEKERQKMVDYMESFFSEAAREDFVKRRILSTCKE